MPARDRFKVFVALDFPGTAAEFLAEHVEVTQNKSADPLPHAELLQVLQDKDACVATLRDRFGEAEFSQLAKLKVVANVAVGFDNIDVAAATKHGVLILNTPGVLDDATADFAFALLLACSRRIVEADRYIRDGLWQKWTFTTLLGCDVADKTLGIVGFGRIGQAVARRARGFGMRILYAQRNRVTETVETELNATHVSLDKLLSESDFVSLHCPLNKETHHLIGQRELSLMKPTSILINTARGAVVDESALVTALQNGVIHSAGLDVFENEPAVTKALIGMPNLVLAPHIGSGSVETRAAMTQLAVDGLLTALSGHLPDNTVNPDAWSSFCARLTEAMA